MTEFGEVVIIKGINASIEDGINHISKVVSGISDTALLPEIAAQETTVIFDQLFTGRI